MSGLEQRRQRGDDIAGIASVASFFVSRIDTAVDRVIGERLRRAPGGEDRKLRKLQGKAAIASARLAYQDYLGYVGQPRWQRLASRGAHPQRLLWGSTSTKNPAYPDVLYVEELIGPDTVNTVPLKTLEAFRDHGHARPSLVEGVGEARSAIDALAAYDISLDEITRALVVEGLALFSQAYDKLLAALRRHR